MLRLLTLLAVVAMACFAQDIQAQAELPSPPVPPPIKLDRNLASVAGQVVDMLGRPLDGAELILIPTVLPADEAKARISIHQAKSDDRGGFSIPNISAGTYNLQVGKAGFLMATSGSLEFEGSPIAPLTFDGTEHKTGVTLRLMSIPKISGRVTDQNGNPVKPEITYIRKTFSQATPFLQDADARIDDDGNFTISGLMPGRYYLRFRLETSEEEEASDGKSDPVPVYVETYYPSVDLMASATALQVVAGHDIAGLDIRMQKAYRVKVGGHLSDLDKLGEEGGSVYLSPLDSAEMTTQGIPVVGGKFEFKNVPPGRYLIATLPYALKDDPDKEHLLVAQETVTVGKTDLRDVVLRSDPVGSISGKVTFEDIPEALKAVIRSLPIGIKSITMPYNGNIAGSSNPDGTFQFPSVPPGDYVLTSGGGLGRFLKSARLNGVDVLGMTLHIAPGANQRLEVVIAFGNAHLSGVVRDANQKPAARVRVSAWGHRPGFNGSNEVFYSEVTGAGGEFTFPTMPPGEYSVLAWERIENGIDGVLEFRSKFMTREATIEVKADGSYTINPPLILRSKSDPVAATIR
ncbi:MAG: carboxypeptidase-like regulatory domain-containing protein [Acidobacteriota bacterium]